MGTNPCCEIALQPFQFCNLCEINASDIESQVDLNQRAAAAAVIGTLQASHTDFHYLRPIWKETTEKEALIGVGMTGIGSGAVLPFNLEEAADVVKNTNFIMANALGINPAARCTTVKPSGTSSLVVGSSSGIHAWHNDFYLRRIRVGKNEAIYQYIATNHPELVVDCKERPDTQGIFEIPQAAPEGSIMRTESPVELLERVHRFNTEWVRAGHRSGNNTHNVSCTISLRDNEWQICGDWMWDNRHDYNGISVLNYDGGTYVQAPFEDITEEEFKKRVPHLHALDLTKVVEMEDNTDLTGEAACAGGACEVI
jgi:ribonucleoside-diphosphate reductase alpha chain